MTTNAALQEIIDRNLGPGRRPKPLRADYARDLVAEDLLQVQSEEIGTEPIPIKAIRQSHHTIARLLARGAPDVEISAIVGITPSRISVLKNSPAFVELLDYYKSMEAEGYKRVRADMHERLAQFGFDTIEELQERLHSNPDSFSNKELLAAVELVSDRTGYGKQSTLNANVTHGLSEATLERIRNVSESGRKLSPEDRQALLSLASPASGVREEASEAEWIEGEGVLIREEGSEGAGEDVGS